MQRLLARQLKKAFPDGLPQDKQVQLFVDLVQQAYLDQAEQAQITERSLDLSCEELNHRNQTLNLILDSLPDVSLWIDGTGKVRDIRAGSIHPPIVTPEENFKSVFDLTLTQSSPLLKALLKDFKSCKRKTSEIEVVVNARDYYLNVILTEVANNRWLLVLQDISLRKKLEELQNQRLKQIERSQLQLQELVNAAPIGILICNPYLDILMINNFLPQLLGLDQEELLDQHPIDFVIDNDRDRFVEHVESALSDFSDSSVSRCDITFKHGEADERQVELALSTLLFDDRKLLIMSLTDISERKALESKLRHFAETDPLTGVMNRRSFYKQTKSLMESCQRWRSDFSILMLDVDYFKKINDSYGHPTGDSVLIELTKQLQTLSNSNYLIGRLGGEEFALSFSGLSVSQAMDFAENIRKQVAETTIQSKSADIKITISIGLVCVDCKNAAPEQLDNLLKRADDCVYQAKNAGRNRVIGES